MNAVRQWAHRWGVHEVSLFDLQTTLARLDECDGSVHDLGKSESYAQGKVRLEAAAKGLRLWRNNVGVFNDAANGTFVRFGLANDSAKVNAALKSADLIGIRPLKITSEHVGGVVGQFVSREIKRPGWRFSGTEREVAQRNWSMLINSFGGDAAFATGEGTL